MATLKTVFVETTVVSLLVARRSNDEITASRQMYTRSWWRIRDRYSLFASTSVRDECALGDPNEAAKRLLLLRLMTPVTVTAEAEEMAGELLKRGILPKKAQTDAIHLATAAYHGIHLLLSWNFKHLVNPEIVKQLYLWAADTKYNVPVICTPEALLRSQDEN